MAEIQLLEGIGAVTAVSAQPTLSVGSANKAAVLGLQQSLAQWGFDPIQFDGIFGPNTKAAVQALQRKLGITADGIVGPGTYKAIENDLASSTSVLKRNASTTALVSTTNRAAPALPANAEQEIPFYSQSWFLPTVLAGGALLFLVLKKKPAAAMAGTDLDTLDAELNGMITPRKKRRKKTAKKKVAPAKKKKPSKRRTGNQSTDGAVVDAEVIARG